MIFQQLFQKMNSRINLFYCSIVALFFLDGCNKGMTTVPLVPEVSVVADTILNGQRILTFSGYSWLVKSSFDKTVGPGPNFFSDSKENVWFDQNGQLHLRITYANNRWNCASVSMIQSHSNGRYLFYVDSRIDNFDKNVVAGLFIYASDTEEIDIEFAKWGNNGVSNSQFTVQPATVAGNGRAYSFNQPDSQSTHWFNWQAGRIDFASFAGHSTTLPAASKIMQQWSYTGKNIPPDANETVHLNLWLFKGTPPSDLQETEIVLSAVKIL